MSTSGWVQVPGYDEDPYRWMGIQLASWRIDSEIHLIPNLFMREQF